jgi:hypothetical protein
MHPPSSEAFQVMRQDVQRNKTFGGDLHRPPPSYLTITTKTNITVK